MVSKNVAINIGKANLLDAIVQSDVLFNSRAAFATVEVLLI
jgi:hypothetical protein